MEGLLSWWRETKFLLIVPYEFEIKYSFRYSNILCLKEGSLDEKFENSKLARVCCKISIQSHLLCVYRYRAINHYLLLY